MKASVLRPNCHGTDVYAAHLSGYIVVEGFGSSDLLNKIDVNYLK